jgi:acetyl esterase/lipase
VASINYRYTTQQPFPGPFEDAVRAIQFLRHHALEYQLDPGRFAAVGPSAGAGLSLYLALHDDFADPAAGDPIARQSTRLTCAVGIDAQVSYDYRFYRAHGLELAMVNVRYQQMYGIESAAAFDQPRHHATAEACAPINFLNRGDPPLYFHYRTPDSFPPASIAHAVHHPLQGRITRAKAQSLDVPAYVHVEDEYGPGFDYIDFLIRCLTGQALPAAGNTAPSATEPTSKNHRMLRNLFKTYPQADANSDCILTRSEMDAFRTPPTQRDVAYGYHERQTLDLYTLKTDRPTPLVIFIHGGGFTGGDKDVIWPEIVQRCQAAGLSVASINYRLSTDQPFPASFVDSARAVQFLRFYARHYNLDPTRFAVAGNSAGGGISLWLAMHDDMARPGSADPIARQSTRVACASVVNAQVSYDYRFYREHGLDMAMQDRRFWKMYGLEKPEQFDDPRHYSVAEQTAAITHLSAGDPPMYLSYEISDAMPPTSVSQAVHHPLHARLLRERAEPLGVPVLIHAGAEHQKIDYLEFLARVLNGQPLS